MIFLVLTADIKKGIIDPTGRLFPTDVAFDWQPIAMYLLEIRSGGMHTIVSNSPSGILMN